MKYYKDRDVYRRENIEQYTDLFKRFVKKDLKECSILDIGCSHGALAVNIAPFVRKVKGIDVKEDMIKEGNEKIEKQGLKNIKLIVQSVYDFDEKNKYDICIVSDVLEHVKEQKELMKISIKATKENGIFYINIPNKWWPFEAHCHIPFITYIPKSWIEPYEKIVAFYDRYINFLRKKPRKKFRDIHSMGYKQFCNFLNELELDYEFVTFDKPSRLLYRIGFFVVDVLPSFWRFANSFQVIAKRRV